MTAIQKDIERYQGYLEFAQDGLFRCHPNDEKRFQELIFSYSAIINTLEVLQQKLGANQ